MSQVSEEREERVADTPPPVPAPEPEPGSRPGWGTPAGPGSPRPGHGGLARDESGGKSGGGSSRAESGRAGAGWKDVTEGGSARGEAGRKGTTESGPVRGEAGWKDATKGGSVRGEAGRKGATEGGSASEAGRNGTAESGPERGEAGRKYTAKGSPARGEAGWKDVTGSVPGESGPEDTAESGAAARDEATPDGPAAGESRRKATRKDSAKADPGRTEATREETAATGNGGDRGEAGPAESAVPEKKASRAGRNLPAAIGVGLLLGAAIIVSLLTVRFLFIGVIAAAIAVGTFEFAGVLRRVADTRIALIPVLVGGQAMIWLSWPFGHEGSLIAFVLTVLACLLWRLSGGAEGYLRDIAGSVFAAAYLPLFASFAAMLVPPDDGVGRVLAFLIGVVASDTGGYIAGVLGGKHPMAPTISPKKSWEGFAGSLVAGIAAGVLTISLMLHGHAWQGAIFGAAIVLTATLGDLVESLIKRDLGIKDMGTLLPGHGGIMDRLDSLLPSAVVSWLLLSAFVPA